MTHGQITFGARHFSQEFTDAQSYDDFAFPTFLPAVPHSSPASKTIGKVDPSYEYAKDQFVYALMVAGLPPRRRQLGAADRAVPGKPAVGDATNPTRPTTTKPASKADSTTGLAIRLAVFDIKWDKPQISASLPSGNLAVYNGNTAESKGFEFESSGSLFLAGLGYSVGFSYADAKLTSDFFLPANVGGVVTPGALSGKSGEQLPGSPKTSATATLTYDRNLKPGYDLGLSLNGTYRSAVMLGLASAEGNTPVQQSSSYAVMNFSATINHQPWRAIWYVTNLLDKQEILVPPFNPGQVGGLTDDYVVNRPRETGLRIAYTF